MNSFKPRVEALLRKAGWRFLRHGKGDHEIWLDPVTLNKVTIDHNIRSRHTANAILKKAGLPKSF